MRAPSGSGSGHRGGKAADEASRGLTAIENRPRPALHNGITRRHPLKRQCRKS
jgi:hypothetical protein